MKIYIAGPITGVENYERVFTEAERHYENNGHFVMNPAVLNEGFEHHEYMHVCYAMIDVREAIVFLPGWENSKGAVMEHEYGKKNGKKLFYAVS